MPIAPVTVSLTSTRPDPGTHIETIRDCALRPLTSKDPRHKALKSQRCDLVSTRGAAVHGAVGFTVVIPTLHSSPQAPRLRRLARLQLVGRGDVGHDVSGAVGRHRGVAEPASAC